MFSSSCRGVLSYKPARNDGAGEHGADGEEVFTTEICHFYSIRISKSLQINLYANVGLQDKPTDTSLSVPCCL